MNKPQFIVIHTAGHGTANVNNDTTAAQIDSWHTKNGWRGIGYHFVIRLDGQVEPGRAENDSGAHTRGLNSRSIGICFSGHADHHPWTAEQLKAGLILIKLMMNQYGIPAANVIGHREAGRNGRPGRRVNKSCPGKLISMEELRDKLRKQKDLVVKKKPALPVALTVKAAFGVLYRFWPQMPQGMRVHLNALRWGFFKRI